MFTDAYVMKTDSQVVITRENYIRDEGSMSQLVSNSAQVEISKHVQDILHSLCTGDWQSEPHQYH